MKSLFFFLAQCADSVRRLFVKLPLPFTNDSYINWLWLLLITSTTGFSQSRISGQVQGKDKPLPFATVLLLSARDSSLVNGAITTETGEYVIEKVQQGFYRVAVAMMGYQKVYSPPFAVSEAEQRLKLPLLVTQPDSRQLNEVTVVAQKPPFEQQLDRLVVNVQNQITAAGATALDILERSPGISVNRQNNTLAMLGKTNVMVMVNGKLTRLPAEAVMQMLAGMNAGNLEKIELITTPPAHFDAEGTGGIINLVLRKNQEYGTNGAFSLTMGYGWYERPGATWNLNHRKKKLNFFADGSYQREHYWFSTYTNRSFLHQGQRMHSSNLSDRDTYHTTYNGRMGFEYNLGPNTSLNGLVSGFTNRQEQFAENEAATYQSGALSTSIGVKDHETNQWRHLLGNLNLQHFFRDKSRVSLDLDYLLYHHHNPHWYENQYRYWLNDNRQQDLMNSSKETPIQIGVGKADYSWKINPKLEMETGLKGTVSSLKNDVVLQRLSGEEWLTDAGFSRDLHMREETGAAYLNVNHQATARTKWQAGLRWEYTHTNLSAATGENLLKRRYHYLFPSFSASREINENNSLQFAYSRRITRPTYSDLSPVFTFVDPYTVLSGNTALRPTLTNAVQAVYQWKKSYFLTLQSSYDRDAISWLMQLDPEQNKQYTFKDNIKGITTYAMSLSLPVSPASWWRMQNSLMGNWQKNKARYQGQDIEVRGYSGQVHSTHTFSLPKNFSLEISGLYKTRSYMGILQFRSSGSVNVGVQKKLNHQGGTLRLTVTDLFWTMRMEAINNMPALNLYQNVGFRYEPRVLRLTYSRKFGNRQLKAINNRATGSEEERRRAGN